MRFVMLPFWQRGFAVAWVFVTAIVRAPCTSAGGVSPSGARGEETQPQKLQGALGMEKEMGGGVREPLPPGQKGGGWLQLL